MAGHKTFRYEPKVKGWEGDDIAFWVCTQRASEVSDYDFVFVIEDPDYAQIKVPREVAFRLVEWLEQALRDTDDA